MKLALTACTAAIFATMPTCGWAEAGAKTAVLLITGAGGDAEYDEAFDNWADAWEKAAAAGDAKLTRIGTGETAAQSIATLSAAIAKEPPAGTEPLWIVMLGHGTTDGRDAKFNLRGDDLTAAELAAMLQPLQRPVVVVAAFSASGAFLAPLSAPGRIVLTATRNGGENNFTRLGKYLSSAIADPAADLDHDGQTSLLEAWISAAQRTADFYKGEGRIATEHSMLDDNGDGRGTPADWFQGIRVVKKTSDQTEPDGLRAHQVHLVPNAGERALSPEFRAQRDALEIELGRLRETRASMPEDTYLAKLEKILVALARIYRGEKAAREN